MPIELPLLDPRQMLAGLISLSVILYALASNLAKTNSERLSAASARILERLRVAWVPKALGELLRWLYYLGIPYLALLLGYNTVRAFGIWNIDWEGGLGYAAALAVGIAVVFIWVWRPFATTQHPHTVDESRWSWARHVLEMLYQESHWALYRSGPILWLGNAYLGSFFGLGLVMLEGWSNPQVRENISDISRADAPLWTGSLAVASTIVFVFTQNTWYALMVHALLDLGLRGIIGFPQIADVVEEPVRSYVQDDQEFDSA